jgi:nucleotide-binding universal stress UspA family protein
MDLQRAGLPSDTAALVVSVADTLLPIPPASSGPVIVRASSHRVAATLVQAHAEAASAVEEASALAREGRQRICRLFPAWRVGTRAVIGTPAQALLDVADEWQSDLIVVGSRGRSALGRFLLGSVSKHVAVKSRHSVRVARHVTAQDREVRIIVGVDGSIGADTAIRGLTSRVWPSGTEVRVMVADDRVAAMGRISLVPTAAEWVQESHDAELAQARAMLEDAAHLLLARGLRVSASIKKGNASEVLKAEAQAWAADCIIVGARGLNTGVERFRAGSVSASLVSGAPCSVEITRATEAVRVATGST